MMPAGAKPLILGIALLLVLALPGISDAVATEPRALNLSIEVFSPGIPEDASTHREREVFPRIREFEALLLPFALRETLANTGQWGAVRIVPEPDPAAELFISGKILRSDGDILELYIRAVDASAAVWIDKVYSGAAKAVRSREESESGARAYQSLYNAIAADLAAAAASHAQDSLAELSMLRYAAQLAPSVFESYLATTVEGNYKIVRLPAENDPTVQRIQRIREVEYLMTDAIDEKFQQLHGDIAPTYDVWREYRQGYKEFQKKETLRLANSDPNDRPGSYEAIVRSYDNYRWARMAKQEQEAWADAFDNEVGPAVNRIEERVAELDDWVDDNYAEWRRLLTEIFELETGLAD
jgi:hypothetical protein